MVLCVAYALLTPCLAWGANITWDDSQPVPSSLQPTDESNNTVTVTFNNNVTANMDVHGSKNSLVPANNNTVTITGTGTITGRVVAAASQSDMSDNTLTITGTTLNVVDGATTDKSVTVQKTNVTLTNVIVTAAGPRRGSVSGASTAGLAKENTVTITGSTIQGWLSAGQGGGVQGKAEGNILHIKDSAVQNAIAGAGTISAADNTLTFEGNSTAFLYLVAGEGKTGGTATGNALIIHGGTVQGEVGGGRAGLNAANNSVEISGGTLHDLVYGGKSTTADATGNSVKISGGTLSNVVYGGHASKAAQGNTIEFSGGSVRSLTGGQSITAEATGNVVMMTGGTATFEVHGGRGVTGTTDNKVEFSGGTVKEGVYGGTNQGAGSALRNTVIVSGTAIAEKGVIGGVSNGGTVESNTVIVRDTADADSAIGGSAFGHDAKNNTVEMTGGKAQFLIGGNSNNAQATGNVVRMTSGTVSVDVRGAQGDTGATDNLVDLSGGTVEGNVRGGLNRRAGSALRNTVLLADAIIVKGNVYGGSSQGLGNNGGTAENNTVSLGGNARVDGGVVGGFSQDHEAKSNAVQMTGGSAVSLTGGESMTANATGNTVQMSAGSVTGDVRGGAGVTGVADNGVDLSGGTVKGDVYGGRNISAGSALRNTVILAAAAIVEKSVYGAHNTGGTAEENGVALGGNARVDGDVVGGFSQDHEAKSNMVQMTGGSAVSLTGGESMTANATGNTVQMSAGSVTGDVRGGAGVTGVADNGVGLSGGTVKGDVYGGRNTGAGSALRNTVILATSAIVEKSVYGGHNTGGTAEENVVALGGNARVDGDVVGGFSQDHEAKSNAVEMTGGSAASLAGGESRTANATGNTVQMSAGSVTGDVRGGAGSTGAMDNTVLLSGGDVAGALYGGLSTGTGNAAGNTVTMTGGTVTAHVAGGQSDTGAATGNIVNIHGGTLGAAVYGGYATGAGTATDNVLNLYGSPDLSASTLYGGMAGGEARSGNTLNVHTSNLVAKNVVNFAKYNFILPDYVRPGDTVLNLTGSDPTLVGNAEVGVGKVGGGMLMQPGDRIFLLRNDGGGVQAEGMQSHNIRGQHGVSAEYDFTVRATDNTVEIYLDPANDPVRIRPEMKALPEAWVATLALINQGAELATRSAVATAQSRKEDPWGLQVFGVMAGASARYNTGSHVDLSGTNMVLGVSKALPVKNAHVLLGVFVEAGFARYQTYNGFSDRPSVTARGNNRYLGGGLLAHASQMVKDSAGARRSRGVYAETSLRAGRMDMDFASSDLRDVAGSQATYTASTPYFGAHVGTGYVWDIGESTTAEVYGQVYWTHLKGNKFSVLGDPVTVEDVNSWRLRGGARINHAWNAHVSGYVGVGYEHSFDGQVKARAYHLRIPTPQLQGGSGLAEAGLHLTPKEGSGFSADISVQGAMGHKQSLGGEVTMRYEF